MFEPGLRTAVYLEGISVAYNLPSENIRSLKEYSIKLLQKKIKRYKFLALNNIELSIRKGEVFGILGRNGAGKSTLLKVISRVIWPTEGRVWVNGIVSPLLELSAGFHPDLTGTENVFLNGTLLGHSRKQIDLKLKEILDFSEIGDFINAPIRTYSSGMVARLGFSIATAWNPDILILDEVLSVGDVAFQKKCKEKIRSFINGESTVILVTHSPQLVESLCTRAIIMEKGEIIQSGTSSEISQIYQDRMTSSWEN